MTIVNGYATLPQIKDWVGETTSRLDTMLEQRVQAASRRIDNLTNRCFYQVTETRVFDACDPWKLDIDDLVSVTTLKTDENADGTFEVTWTANVDYQLHPLNPNAAPEQEPYREAHAIAARSFPLRFNNRDRAGRVQINGVWGWPAIPDGVFTACLMLAGRGVGRRKSPEGVAGFGEFGPVRISRTDPDVWDYVGPYWLPVAA